MTTHSPDIDPPALGLYRCRCGRFAWLLEIREERRLDGVIGIITWACTRCGVRRKES